MPGFVDRLANILMPEEEIIEKESKEETIKEESRRRLSSQELFSDRPVLTVHQNASLKMKVFVPTSFDQVKKAADCLKAKEAVIVNYEEVDESEQRRICDFLNGVCYVLDGDVQRITDVSVLYVPDSVDISKEMCSYKMPIYAKEG